MSLELCMIFHNKRGFSLITVVLLAGALAGIAILSMNLIKQQTKSTAKTSFSSNALFLINDISTALADINTCSHTFGVNNTPSELSIYDKNSQTYIPNYISGATGPVDGYRGDGLNSSTGIHINSYSLTPTANPNPLGAEETLTVSLVNKNILKVASGALDTVSKTIPLFVVRDTTGKVTSCRRVALFQSDIWQQTASNGPSPDGLYYKLPNGITSVGGVKVGINTSSAGPDAACDLDVRDETEALGSGIVQSDAVYEPSDKRLKNNIKTLSHSLNKVLSIRGVSFNWKVNGKSDIGVIAQELKNPMPETILHSPGNDTLRVYYLKILPYLIEAIKTQHKEIDDLEIKVKNLQ